MAANWIIIDSCGLANMIIARAAEGPQHAMVSKHDQTRQLIGLARYIKHCSNAGKLWLLLAMGTGTISQTYPYPDFFICRARKYWADHIKAYNWRASMYHYFKMKAIVNTVYVCLSISGGHI